MNKEVKLSRDQRKWLRQGDNAVKFGQQMFINGGREAKIKAQDNTLAIVFSVLHDEFGFGKQRLERTLQRVNAKVDALEYGPNKADGITYETLKEDLKNETGFTFTIQRENKSMQGLPK